MICTYNVFIVDINCFMINYLRRRLSVRPVQLVPIKCVTKNQKRQVNKMITIGFTIHIIIISIKTIIVIMYDIDKDDVVNNSLRMLYIKTINYNVLSQ